jgi:hypothetical protein
MIAMNVVGPFTGPKGMMTYVHLIASGPWKANFSCDSGDTES